MVFASPLHRMMQPTGSEPLPEMVPATLRSPPTETLPEVCSDCASTAPRTFAEAAVTRPATEKSPLAAEASAATLA